VVPSPNKCNLALIAAKEEKKTPLPITVANVKCLLRETATVDDQLFRRPNANMAACGEITDTVQPCYRLIRNHCGPISSIAHQFGHCPINQGHLMAPFVTR
jgi:hypothetical protein